MTEPTRPSGLEQVRERLTRLARPLTDAELYRRNTYGILEPVDAWEEFLNHAREDLTAALAENERLKAELDAEHETTRNDPAEQRVERYALEASDLTGRLIKAEAENERLRQELQGGHTRLNECSGWEATKDLPLYDRISKKIEQLCHERDEQRFMLLAVGCEKDELLARTGAAEHRRCAAEHRATRIELDKELLERARKAEAECAALRQEDEKRVKGEKS